MKWYGLILFAVLVEMLITYIKRTIVDRRISWQLIASPILGVVFALLFNLDILPVIGVSVPLLYVGQILTGLMISRLSNYLYDIIRHIIFGRADSVSDDPEGYPAESVDYEFTDDGIRGGKGVG